MMTVAWGCSWRAEEGTIEVDDEFAQLISEFDTVEEMRADLAEAVVRMARLEQASAARDAVISDLVAKTPFELPGILNAAKRLLAFGTAAEDIPDTLLVLGDVAAGTNSQIDELADAYGRIMAQGTPDEVAASAEKMGAMNTHMLRMLIVRCRKCITQ